MEEVLDLVKITSLSDCLPTEISTGMKRAVAIALPSGGGAATPSPRDDPLGVGRVDGALEVLEEIEHPGVGERQNLDWKVEIPGAGNSSPIVSKQRIFLQKRALAYGRLSNSSTRRTSRRTALILLRVRAEKTCAGKVLAVG